eukprot:2256172-Rhodomonas_salina.8
MRVLCGVRHRHTRSLRVSYAVPGTETACRAVPGARRARSKTTTETGTLTKSDTRYIGSCTFASRSPVQMRGMPLRVALHT